MAGGGGGDGGAAAREQAEQKRRAEAIDQINAYFGIQPTAKTVQTKNPAYVPPSYVQDRTQITGPPPGWSAEKARSQRPAFLGLPDPSMVDTPNPLADTATANAAGRTALYDETRSDVFDLNMQKLAEYAADADRERRFALARRGQSGGSVDVDSGARFQRTYEDSATDASRMADTARLDFRTADEQSRLNLINMINAGGDVNTALTSGANALQLNRDNARSAAGGQLIGNTFGDLATTYAYGNDIRGREDAARRYSSGRSATGSGLGKGDRGRVVSGY
jgi:hypothetical protein